ncbi:MarR family winged helix-turn-helix transcriptional regulator [Paenibacillus beijingensis]|uniref:MarR family transcriptional regulator n=1 Tax=Paenibacillus beijingensis TaxID=1126833 RepID=A0A0D5NG27_9BACL|nr:MarR family transcriptional regulator [Paenibacillus beijingensis]AJY74095.1 MarR family transcriptional regulator [Paenibacillus beijingensis]
MDERPLLCEIIKRYEIASFTVDRRINALVKDLMPEDLTTEQYWVIRYIQMRERSTSSELAEVFCVGKSSVTAIVTRLADKALIQRIPDPSDRRVTYLQLTEEGVQLAEQMEQVIQDLLAGLIGHFTADEAKQFLELYEKLAHVLLHYESGLAALDPGAESETE